RGLRVVVALDEYERLQEALDAGWGRPVLDALRYTVQYRERVGLIFTGVQTFAEVGAVWTDCFIGSRRERVSFLSRGGVSRPLADPSPDLDPPSADGAPERLIPETNAQPFLAQAVAFELVLLLNKQRRKEATCDDVDGAITAALSRAGAY